MAAVLRRYTGRILALLGVLAAIYRIHAVFIGNLYFEQLLIFGRDIRCFPRRAGEIVL